MIVYFVFLLFILQVGTKSPKFKVKLMTITKCKLPDAKWSPAQPPPAQFAINKLDRKTTVLSGDFIIDKPLGPILIAYRTYQLQQNSARNLIFKIERVSCTNPITFKMVQLLHVNMTKDCFVFPGHYVFKKFDLDKLTWLLTKSITVQGKYTYEVEFSDSKGILSCYDLVSELIELPHVTL